MFKKWLTPMCNLKTEPWDVGLQGSCKFSVRTVWVSVQSLNHVWLFVTPQTIACQASLSITHSHSLLKLMSIESVMGSNQLILCRLLCLLPLIFPRIRVFSSESALYIRWPKYWSFSFSISPSNEHSECSRWEPYKIQIRHLCLVTFFSLFSC